MRGRQLTALPAELSRLVALRRLNVEWNQLDQLPPELYRLQLDRLDAEANNDDDLLRSPTNWPRVQRSLVRAMQRKLGGPLPLLWQVAHHLNSGAAAASAAIHKARLPTELQALIRWS